jgi:GNAT superfamily N-acetyltransferase
VVEMLLARGADPERRAEPGIGGTALGWTAHGSFHSPGPVAGGGTDHLRIAELLVAAGAKVEPDMAHEAAPELAAWLTERAEADAPPPEPHPDVEASWAAQAEWLRRVAASPVAEVRALGDGFAVRSGDHSNADSGVVCSAGVDDAAIAEIIAWFQATGTPGQWLIGAGSELGPRLVAAGCRAERTAVIMGAAVADLPVDAQPPDGVEIVEADRARWLVVAEASGFFEDGATRSADVLDAVDDVIRLVALRDGEPVGIAGAIAAGETLYLQYLVVLESERGRGVGRSLTAARLRAAPGCRRAVLDPAPDAIVFHRRLGFELRPALRDRVYYLPLRKRAE